MSDINKCIGKWKEELVKTDSFNMDNIEELESHLRDSIEELKGQELSEEEAFLVARSRLGDASKLTEEFSKENGILLWGRRVLWMLFGIVIFRMGLQFNTILVFLISRLALLFGVSHKFVMIMSICLLLGLTCLLIVGMILGPVMYVRSEAIKKKQRNTRKAIIVFCVLAIVLVFFPTGLSPQYIINAHLQNPEDIRMHLMFYQVFLLVYPFLIGIVPIVGIIILDRILRKKRPQMCVEG